MRRSPASGVTTRSAKRKTSQIEEEIAKERFTETVEHMLAYLRHVVEGLPARQHYVAGFLEPYANPLGHGLGRDDLANFKVFVRRLNDVLAEWCESQPATWLVDASEISAVYMALVRHVLGRRTTNLGQSPVKLVITDLDNTLWRGVAAEGPIGTWAGRPMGYVVEPLASPAEVVGTSR